MPYEMLGSFMRYGSKNLIFKIRDFLVLESRETAFNLSYKLT